MNTNSRAAVGVSTSFPGRNTDRSLENALEISMEAQLMHWVWGGFSWQRICLGVVAVGLGTPL